MAQFGADTTRAAADAQEQRTKNIRRYEAQVKWASRYRQLLAIAERLVHLDARLRLRSPATPAEIKAWAELRAEARAVIADMPREG